MTESEGHQHGDSTGAGRPRPGPPPYPGLLARGSTGASVSALQTRLLLRGWQAVVVDGEFGPATEATVRAFQSEKGLEVDGRVGPQTWTALWTAPIT